MQSAHASRALTVAELRKRWLPHKKRFENAGRGHPTAIRFHRACSWLEEAERLDAEDQVDHILVSLNYRHSLKLREIC